VLAASTLLLACAKDPVCEHRFTSSEDSPDGTRQAAIVEVHCGAARAMSWVLIGAAHAKFRDEADRVALFEGSATRLEWRGGDLLVIYGQAKPVTAPAVAKGVHIDYLDFEPAINLGTLH
jgi:hypothetical protein